MAVSCTAIAFLPIHLLLEAARLNGLRHPRRGRRVVTSRAVASDDARSVARDRPALAVPSGRTTAVARTSGKGKRAPARPSPRYAGGNDCCRQVGPAAAAPRGHTGAHPDKAASRSGRIGSDESGLAARTCSYSRVGTLRTRSTSLAPALRPHGLQDLLVSLQCLDSRLRRSSYRWGTL